MQIGIIHDAPTPPWSARELIKAARREGLRAYYYRISRLHGYIEERGINNFVYRTRSIGFDAGIVRSLGFITSSEQLTRRLSLLKHLEISGIPLINPSQGIMMARDKYLSLVVLAREGLPVPPTLATEDIDTAVEAVKRWERVVVKPLIGSMGRGSIKLSDPDTAFNVFKTLLSFGQPLYIQKYIEKKDNMDIRAFVIGDNVIAAEKRTAPPGSWKTNIAQGGRAESASLTPEVEELAIRASRALGLEYSGVDLAFDADGRCFVFEVNASPLWRGLMQATGVNPATHIVRRLLEIARG